MNLKALNLSHLAEITETEARSLISNKHAGYWEARLRDSISPVPIAHPKQIVIFIDGKWYLVGTDVFRIDDRGRIGNEQLNAHAAIIQCSDAALAAAIQDEMARFKLVKMQGAG